MRELDELRASLPAFARDHALNLSSVLDSPSLTDAQRWGVAVAAAITAGEPRLRDAILAAARERVDETVIEDARAAAGLMAMNNVYYRFRHMIGKPSYAERPARLRMTRIAKPAASKADFELFCLAVSAQNGCEACVRSHEQAVVAAGLGEEQVHDAVRIAAALSGARVALSA